VLNSQPEELLFFNHHLVVSLNDKTEANIERELNEAKRIDELY